MHMIPVAEMSTEVCLLEKHMLAVVEIPTCNMHSFLKVKARRRRKLYASQQIGYK